MILLVLRKLQQLTTSLLRGQFQAWVTLLHVGWKWSDNGEGKNGETFPTIGDQHSAQLMKSKFAEDGGNCWPFILPTFH